MGRSRVASAGAGRTGALVLLACALLAQVALPAFAQAPAEVTGVAVCSESRDCFSWAPVPEATGYRLYRGESSTLAGLLDEGIDSCLRLTSVDPWTGPEVLEPGPHGAFFWYLVTATGATSEGPAGDASAGPRVVNSSGSCPFVCRDDYIPQANLTAAEEPGSGGCPAGMTLAGTFCVDRFEASLVRVSDGAPWPPFVNPGTAVVRAVSVRDAVPQGYINMVQAQSACQRSGKRLCTDTEWLRACRGLDNWTYPYGPTVQPGVCNDNRAVHPAVEYFGTTDPWIWSELDHPCLNQLPDSLDRTGRNGGCVTPEGVYDMMGNLHEWTADPAGTFRGGYYVDTVINGSGCLYRTTAHDGNHWDFSTGFRCCADAF
jgi:hypothetical protein